MKRCPALTLIALIGCRSEPRGPAVAASSAPPAIDAQIAVPDARAAGDASSALEAGDDAATGTEVPAEDLEERDTKLYKSVETICREFVASRRKSKPHPALLPTPPSCREVKLPVPFAADGTFRGARAITFDSGTQDWTQLVLEIAGGVLHAPISWEYFDPDASQHEQHPGSLEALRIESGKLVATVGREEGWTSPAFKPTPDRDAAGDIAFLELRLVRGVAICELLPKPAFRCKSYFPSARTPFLGVKRRPWPPTWPPKEPWSSLAWDRVMPAFAIDAGTLRVSR